MKYIIMEDIECRVEDDVGIWKMTLCLWNCEDQEKLATESGDAPLDSLGEFVLQMGERILNGFTKRSHPLDSFYRYLNDTALPFYLDVLDQAFVLNLVANKSLSKDTILDERTMLNFPLNMEIRWAEVDILKIIYISTLTKFFICKFRKSTVLSEYKDKSLALFRKDKENRKGSNLISRMSKIFGIKSEVRDYAEESEAAKLEPILWKVFGIKKELRYHIKNLPKNTTSGYSSWLKKVEAFK